MSRWVIWRLNQPLMISCQLFRSLTKTIGILDIVCSWIKFCVQGWGTLPVSASRTGATWRRWWCCWSTIASTYWATPSSSSTYSWWSSTIAFTYWAGLMCAAQIKFHQLHIVSRLAMMWICSHQAQMKCQKGNHLQVHGQPQDIVGNRCPAMTLTIAGSKYYCHNRLVTNIFSLTGSWRRSSSSEDTCYRLIGDFCSRCSTSSESGW